MTTAPLKIVFAGTPPFSVPSLRALIDAGQDIRAVYTQPDRPAGRGRRLTASPVKETATAAGLPVFQPPTLRDPGVVRSLRRHEADLIVVVAYGHLLPPPVLELPRLGCVNVHASLLPRWRGAAPIARCILAGDRESGVTIMGMEAGLDTGPLYLQQAIPLEENETGRSLHDKLAALGASALPEALPGIADGTLPPEPQDDALATHAEKLTKEEARIDWSRPAVELNRMIRAFDPWPVAQTRLGETTLRLWGSELPDVDAGPEPPGRVVRAGKTGIDVATGDGLLRITRLQPQGKRPMAAAAFLNAHHVEGETFG
ncbi:methionyl-tRNA formyltransferase [Candidatus Thiosymbion oneisti]|uniref:methionyl-tRNA formyltransferase n=1 Tax=Candidatus Thiosymbion oneisti TaxID=589554 RepID=UPI000B19250D|nr:methionyl-tRNA formyltransferase [Candidatus Thiosymbion oneisti]